ncbi:MAG: DUF302 domain-containing protein [Gammaproteobacteria bacterium]|nr:DUF302 domain-containing protein [Gammaproteobacteria bacterium]
MNKLISHFLIVLLIGFAQSAAASNSGQPQMFLQTQSPKGFKETVKVFKEEVKKGKWSILNVTNLSGILSSKGYTLHPVLIFDVCSGKYSAKILAKDEYRFVTPLMPCRTSIYKTSKGKVSISRLNAHAMAPMFDPGLADIMLKSSDEIEAIISKTISRLKK